MKKSLVVGLAIGLASLTAASAFAVTGTNNLGLGRGNRGGAGIVGSSHDLSNAAGTGSTTASGKAAAAVGLVANGNHDAQSRICVYCHHPHNSLAASSVNGNYSPLWNRTTVTATFTGYDNGVGAPDATIMSSDKRHALNSKGSTTLQGVSLLCMSCHDGVTALNAYSITTGSDQIDPATSRGEGKALTGTAAFTSANMTNHHPMGFVYDDVAAADAEIKPSNSPMYGSVTISDLLYGATGTMECVTCHDVHNSGNNTDAERFLWTSNNKSAFCLACHNK